MGIMTKDQYIESLRRMHPTVYMFGERVENVVDNPRLRAGIEATGATYAMAEMPEYRDLIVARQPAHRRGSQPLHPSSGLHRGSGAPGQDQPGCGQHGGMLSPALHGA